MNSISTSGAIDLTEEKNKGGLGAIPEL